MSPASETRLRRHLQLGLKLRWLQMGPLNRTLDAPLRGCCILLRALETPFSLKQRHAQDRSMAILLNTAQPGRNYLD